MPIAGADVEPGWIYRTSRNQERLVLGKDAHGRIVYASRGGNVKNPFKNQRSVCSPETFAEKCDARVRRVDDLQSFIDANSAGTIIVP